MNYKDITNQKWQLYRNYINYTKNAKLFPVKKLEAPANYASASVSRSAPLGARTLDTLIKSQVLYQLS